MLTLLIGWAAALMPLLILLVYLEVRYWWRQLSAQPLTDTPPERCCGGDEPGRRFLE